MHGSGAPISREVFWNIVGPGFPTEQVLLYFIVLVTVAFMVRGLVKGGFFTRLKVMMSATGTDVDRLNKPGDRFWYAVTDVLFHKKILREPYQGTFHLFILWGFIALTITTAIVFLQADVIYPIFHVWFMQGNFYLALKLFANVFGLLAIVGVLMALYRRYVMKPNWLDNRAEDTITLWFILAILVTGFCVEGLRMAATEFNPESPMYPYRFVSVGGWLVGSIFAGAPESSIRSLHRGQ
jgi:nitrate reductase gamma subunit